MKTENELNVIIVDDISIDIFDSNFFKTLLKRIVLEKQKIK